MATILGLRGTGDFVTGERPESWHEGILYIWPHGKAPLLALLSKGKKEKVSDWKIHWFEQDLVATREITVSDYDTTNHIVTFSAVAPVTVGTVLKQLDSDMITIRLTTKINDKKWYYTVLNGTESNLDTNVKLTVIGNAHKEGAQIPEAYSVQPTPQENYCQIFRVPVKVSRTAKQTKLRTGDLIAREKKEKLHMIGMDIEMAMLHGYGSSSEPRTMKGIYELLAAGGYTTSGASLTLSAFWDILATVFAYGSPQKVAFGGAKAIKKLVELVEGKIYVEPVVNVYGISLSRWVTPWGELLIKPHPLMTGNSQLTDDLIIVDFEHMTYCYLQDIEYVDYKNNLGYDATIGEYIAECCIRLDNLRAHHYVYDIS